MMLGLRDPTARLSRAERSCPMANLPKVRIAQSTPPTMHMNEPDLRPFGATKFEIGLLPILRASSYDSPYSTICLSMPCKVSVPSFLFSSTSKSSSSSSASLASSLMASASPLSCSTCFLLPYLKGFNGHFWMYVLVRQSIRRLSDIISRRSYLLAPFFLDLAIRLGAALWACLSMFDEQVV